MRLYILAAVLIATGARVWFRSGKLLGRLSVRLVQLESNLNCLAVKAYGESEASPLLDWENQMREQRHSTLSDLMGRRA